MAGTDLIGEQEALWPNGFNLLTVKFVVHLDGPNGTYSSGYTVSDTVAGSWIESHVDTRGSALAQLTDTEVILRDVLERTRRRLSPF